MILEQKIRQTQDAGNMSYVTYLQLLDETNDEFYNEDTQVLINVKQEHLGYYKYASEYLFLKAITK